MSTDTRGFNRNHDPTVDPLVWEEKEDPPHFGLHAKRGDHHFIVAQRPDEQQWTLTLYSTSVKDPAGNP